MASVAPVVSRALNRVKHLQATRADIDYTSQLASHASRLQFDMLPEMVVERTRHVVLDTCGAMISGSQLEAGRATLEFARELPSSAIATVVGANLRLGTIDAAFVNAALAHADETDDAHTAAAVHPGSMAVPAALAAGESVALSGKELIASVVVGYDVACRVSRAMDVLVLKKRGFSTSPICGSFGAAAAAARALAFDVEHMVGALGLVGLQSAGLYAVHQDPVHFAKAIQIGFAARDGVCAAMVASHRSPPPVARILDGRDNVVAAFSDRPQFEQLTAELGQRYEILGTNIKYSACGSPIRWAVDGLLDLMSEHRFTADEIARIDVRLAHTSVELVGPTATIPATTLSYVLAVAAFDGFVGIEQTHSPSRLNDPRVRGLQERVHLEGDDELQRLFPARRPAIVTVALGDGRVFRMRVEYARGSPERPLSREEVEEKFIRLSAPVIGHARARAASELIGRLEDVSDIRELTACLQLTSAG